MLFPETWPKIESVGWIFLSLTMVLNYAKSLTNGIFTHSSLCCLLFSFYFDMFCYFSGKMIWT